MLECIRNRHSIRRFKDQPIEEYQLEEILRAAMQAPTARNAQSWRFVVIRNRKALEDMIQLQPYTGMMKEAALAVMVLGDRTASSPDEYLYCDASAAIENMLLEAGNQGLGGCWCAIGPKEERITAFRDYYQIEENLLPIAVVALGVPNEEKEKTDRYDPQKVRYLD